LPAIRGIRRPSVFWGSASCISHPTRARLPGPFAKGVFVSANKGASRKAVGAGLKAKKITSLIFNSALRALFAGTNGAGICAREL